MAHKGAQFIAAIIGRCFDAESIRATPVLEMLVPAAPLLGFAGFDGPTDPHEIPAKT
jgi:hypothetical protein